MSCMIHSTALVDDGASIGFGVKIWHWSHICSTASIGECSSLGQNVYVGNNVKIGRRVKIQNNVSVYDCVELGDDVFCGPSVVFTNVLNPRSEVPRKHEYKPTKVCKGASLGANSTIVCGVIIGSYAFVGAGAVVTRNLSDFALVTGVPAKQTGWMSRHGTKIPLPIEGNGEWVCPHTNDRYLLKGKKLELQTKSSSA